MMGTVIGILLAVWILKIILHTPAHLKNAPLTEWVFYL
jgi:hypothetical protein